MSTYLNIGNSSSIFANDDDDKPDRKYTSINKIEPDRKYTSIAFF